jgi:hypothetical protein
VQKEIDIIEDKLLHNYPKVLEILLYDQTTKKNIIWATKNYEDLGSDFQYFSHIKTESITGFNNKVIMPRILKNKMLQKRRVKDMAEVYTSSWICNAQINSIDSAWFGKENIFNRQIISNNGTITWKTNKNKIKFPKSKNWKDYLKDIRLEITCGEAPYLTSRYDTTTGKYIPVKDRIGFLDRKLRVIGENIKTKKYWLKYAKLAYKSIYGYEFHGDSLLLARESLLYTFIENYYEKFLTEPKLEEIQNIATIISWNLWQMDGLKFVVPNSCTNKIKIDEDPFNTTETITECKGCKINDDNLHNGIYCTIMDWEQNKVIRFIDMLKKSE